jgi:hypothetical protein
MHPQVIDPPQHVRWLGILALGALLASCSGGGGDPPAPPAGNTPPTISGVPATSVVQGTSYVFAPSAADADGDTLTFGVDAKPAWATFNTGTGQLTGTPTTSDVGMYSGIVVWVSDGNAQTRLPSYDLSVAADSSSSQNRAPLISGTAPTTAIVGLPYSFTPTASDPDANTLTFSIVNRPVWATFSTSTGSLQGTPAAGNIGTTGAIAITVSDGALNTSLPAFGLAVVAAPPPPIPGPPPTGTPYPGYTYTLPTVRPFISLDAFNGISRTAPAYTRLKAQVDDVVTVTNGVSATATYDQLVSALNSGHYGYSAADSVLMFRLTADPQYIQQAIRMVDLFVISENVKIAAGTMPVINGDSYLEVGFFMEQLALTYDYGYDRLSTTQRAAWSAYAEQAIFNVWNPTNARWGSVSRPWSGWSVDDPGNNYFYSFLKATQLWALASQSSAWIGFLQTQKYTQLVPFFSVLTGGGSREGTGYGTAMGSLFENYTYWKDSTGEDLSSYSSHARDTIDYWIHATVPTLDYYAAIGDQSRSSMPLMFDYQRKLMAEAVALYAGAEQGRRGTWWLNRVKVTDGGSGSVVGRMRYNYNFRYDLLAMAPTEQAPAALVYDTPGVGALFARSDWTTTASWLHTNAGFYDQSHAHQDQGAFSFFKGTWLTVTSNIYSNSGINQGVDVGNVIRFMSGGNTIGQNESISGKTFTDSGGLLLISENLTPAYSRNAGLVSSWLRDFTYNRAQHSLRVQDRCTVAGGVTPVWQLHVPVLPVIQQDGTYLAGTLRIAPIAPAAPTVTIVNMHALSSEFDSGYRLELTAPPGVCDFTIVLTAQ